ncbi:MAG: bifunctional methylenetetrahydrofolate dehydrogenase/methenyltetrahydrofolate cyclohydrolase FolD [Azospirillum sp.]|nr:bifunctional methylenetetrahydrofolate dehydrogenase/methenyltetrahydrofolate cyclohydrolase FolD [Azospirillum sp.]
MTDATVIDGKAFALGLRQRVAAGAAELKAETGVVPGLAVVLVGDDPASWIYVRNKGNAATTAGMRSFDHRFGADTDQATLLSLIDRLNRDPLIHGILVQLPLPAHIDAEAVIEAIDPAKDVDGFHPINVGRLGIGLPLLAPCTPLGCLMLLRHYAGSLAGRKALVLGRSNIVGRPMAQLLLGADCTVTIAHSRTRDLIETCREADILVAAVGRPEMIRGDWIKPGAVVIDVGINRIAGAEPGKTRLVGDVHYAEAAQVAAAVTPVPGGVGPMTIACLLLNTLAAACRGAGLPPPPEARP